MKLKYNVLKIIAFSFGLLTFCWMIYEYLSKQNSVNDNYIKANQAFLEKKYNAAYNYYNKALLEDSKSIYFLEGKARSLFRLGKIDEAEIIFKDVIERDQTFVAAIANLGILYDTKGDYERALKYYKIAIESGSKVTKGMSWLKIFLKNIHFKPTNIEERLVFLENNYNKETKKIELKNLDIDKIQPDFEM